MYVQELLFPVPVFVNGEEKDFMALYEHTTRLYKRELSPRQQRLADNLVRKRVLERKKDTKKKRTFYVKASK